MDTTHQSTTRHTILFLLLTGSLGCAIPAAAQCTDATLNSALAQVARDSSTIAQMLKSQSYYATICSPIRYAGGTYTAATLPNYIRASVACQDPWIGQAFLDLGYQLNGNSPLASPTPFSILGDCTASKYGSWSSFTSLKSNVQNVVSSGRYTPNSPGKAAIDGPSSFPSSQTATVTWVVTDAPGPQACAAGVKLIANGMTAIQLSAPLPITARQVAVSLPANNLTYKSGGSITLQLVDACTGLAVSDVLKAAVAAPGTIPTPALGVATTIAGIDSNGYLLDQNMQRILNAGAGFGVLWAQSGNIILSGGGTLTSSGIPSLVGHDGSSMFPILVDSQGRVLLISQDGSNFTIRTSGGQIVAQGAGNIVSQGAGNLVNAKTGVVLVTGCRIIGFNGSGFQTSSIQTMAATIQSAASMSGITSGSSLNDVVSGDSLNAKILYMRNNPQPAATYKLLAVTSNANASAWPVSNTLPISWTSSGAPASNQTVSVFLQFSGSNTMSPLLSAIRASANSAVVPALSSFFKLTQNMSANLIVRNDQTPSMIVSMPVQILAAPAAAPVVFSQFSVPPLWANNAALTVNWNYSGAPPANQSVAVVLRYGSNSRTVCGPVPVTSKTCRTAAYAWSGFKVNTPGTLTLVDGVSYNPVYPNAMPVTLSIK